MLIAYSIISIGLIVCYLAIIASYIYYWKRLVGWDLPVDFEAKTSVTVIVAARNEAANIKRCVEALLALDYPSTLVEFCLVNDHSEDATANIIKAFEATNVRLLELKAGQTGKKKAIEVAIQQSSGQLIVTTDADCIMDKNWLNYIVSYYQQYQPKFIAAPVSFYEEKSLFERFQSLDFMGMMAVSGAGIEGAFMNMCNGANLAYERAAFYAVGGFQGIDHVASGDDMLLMQKIAKQYPGQLGYLKQPQAQTQTHAKPSVKAFVQQRIRWTSKSGAYDGWQVLFMLATVWILCVTMCVDVVLIAFDVRFLYLFLSKFIFKGLADYFFLGMMAHFFDRRRLMKAFVPALFLHWWYIALVGTLGNFSKQYEWKGRSVQ